VPTASSVAAIRSVALAYRKPVVMRR